MRTNRRLCTILLSAALIDLCSATIGRAQVTCSAPTVCGQPLIAGNDSVFGGGPIQLYDFASGGDPVAAFVPDGSAGAFGLGIEVIGNEIFYTEFKFSPSIQTDFIRVAPFPGGPDKRTLPNPSPTTAVAALSFSQGVLYAMTGFPGGPAHQVWGLDPADGRVVWGPTSIGVGADQSADGFSVLPSGRFLINEHQNSCTYHEFDRLSGTIVPGTTILVPGAVGACAGVDTDGTSLYFNADASAFVKTDLAGNFIARADIATNQLSDISLVHPLISDQTPPSTTANVSHVPNAAGWNNSPVDVFLTAVDPLSSPGVGGSGVASITYSETGAQVLPATPFPGATATLQIAAEGVTLVSFHATDAAGNVETPEHILVVRLDSTPPATTALLSPAANVAGWNNAPVTVTLTAVDPAAANGAAGSGVATVSYAESGAQTVAQIIPASTAQVPITAQGTTTVSFQAIDVAGNVEPQTPGVSVKIDATKPAITFSGNAGTYTVAQTVTITCAASDALSGIASDTCASATLNNVPAYTLGVGLRTLQATATDRAGNTASASTTCSVTVSAQSLCTLQTQFVQGSTTYAAMSAAQKSATSGILVVLCRTLSQITPGLTATQRNGLLAVYKKNVDQLVLLGLVTTSQQTILLKLASAL